MVVGLAIGTDRAIALQQSIEDELMKRGYSTDADPVMAEYITIMIINNKTAPQITSELEDLIGDEFDASFTDWLFAEAEKGAASAEPAAAAEPSTTSRPTEPPIEQPNPTEDGAKRPPNAPRSGLYQQALSQAGSSAQKRTVSARSPSPNHPNKSRRTDLPTAPRAMARDGQPANPRSLLDRMNNTRPRNNHSQNGSVPRDEIQARIDNITNAGPGVMIPPSPANMQQNMQQNMGGMDMNMVNPIMLQEMMMNQMAMMAQMANSMGMMNPAALPFNGAGMPMQPNMPMDMSQFQNGGGSGFVANDGSGRGRGGPRRGGRGGSIRGRGGPPNSASPSQITDTQPNAPAPAPVLPVTQPTPVAAPTTYAAPAAQTPIPFAVPERPQSPTLCKFGAKCTNAHCRWSHPSPVATAESGVVLSNQACEQGRNCKDKDCIYAHVSPAVLKPSTTDSSQQPQVHNVHHPPPAAHAAPSATPCRFGAGCTRPNCTFAHPAPVNSHFAQQCRFGSGCTRAACPFQHPPGRVLPSTFHRGLSTTSPLVSVATPEAGTMGSGPSPHRSMTFNSAGSNSLKEKLAQQMKELEEKKKAAETAVKEAEAAAASKGGESKEESNPVAITA